MKGLELSKKYFQDVIYPMLLDEFPEFVNRMAVGLVGEGSECFGYDDEISRDHDWGAKVCIWLDTEDYNRIGTYLSHRLSELPSIFQSYPVCWIPGRNGVMEIDAFFIKYLNAKGPLQTIGQWMHVPEHYLAVASNGEVFFDPSGKFSAIWKDLRMGYPEDIRLKKIAARCMKIGQSGQYNYLRSMRRGDKVAAELALSEFIQSVISVIYLLNNKYTPFYKWMFHGMKELPLLGMEMADSMERLLDSENRADEIERICVILINEFRRQKITDCADGFMVAQGESVHQHIQNENLRATNPWAGD